MAPRGEGSHHPQRALYRAGNSVYDKMDQLEYCSRAAFGVLENSMQLEGAGNQTLRVDNAVVVAVGGNAAVDVVADGIEDAAAAVGYAGIRTHRNSFLSKECMNTLQDSGALFEKRMSESRWGKVYFMLLELGSIDLHGV